MNIVLVFAYFVFVVFPLVKEQSEKRGEKRSEKFPSCTKIKMKNITTCSNEINVFELRKETFFLFQVKVDLKNPKLK